MNKIHIQRIVAVFTLLCLLVAGMLGTIRSEGALVQQIQSMSSDLVNIQQQSESVFTANRKSNPHDKLYIGVASHPSYGGPLFVAVILNENKVIERVALVESTDTSTYIQRVLEAGILDDFLGSEAQYLPEIETVTGATLSSVAMMQGVEKAIAAIEGNSGADTTFSLSHVEIVKIGSTLCIFLLAYLITSSMYRWNKSHARWTLLSVSTVVLGFMYGTQFSLSSLVLLLSGIWLSGLASYASLLCLICAIAIFFFSKKNLYCNFICPFGAIQEGLGRITQCSAIKRPEYMKWIARLFSLCAMCAALYYRNASVAQFEPFSIAFSFIGSTLIFALTISIVIASFFIRRPWCTLLCPVSCIFDYLMFMRSWLMPKKSVQKG